MACHVIHRVRRSCWIQCPPPSIRTLSRRFGTHFPVAEIHPHALLAAQAAEAAGAQGRFWEMHDLLFSHPHHLNDTDLHDHARSLGLDMPRFVAEFADQVYLQRVQEHIASGRASQVRSTPCFFVDGTLVDVSFGVEQLAGAVESRSRAPRPT